jgi:hypothetical protein
MASRADCVRLHCGRTRRRLGAAPARGGVAAGGGAPRWGAAPPPPPLPRPLPWPPSPHQHLVQQLVIVRAIRCAAVLGAGARPAAPQHFSGASLYCPVAVLWPPTSSLSSPVAGRPPSAPRSFGCTLPPPLTVYTHKQPTYGKTQPLLPRCIHLSSQQTAPCNPPPTPAVKAPALTPCAAAGPPARLRTAARAHGLADNTTEAAVTGVWAATGGVRGAPRRPREAPAASAARRHSTHRPRPGRAGRAGRPPATYGPMALSQAACLGIGLLLAPQDVQSRVALTLGSGATAGVQRRGDEERTWGFDFACRCTHQSEQCSPNPPFAALHPLLQLAPTTYPPGPKTTAPASSPQNAPAAARRPRRHRW